MKQALRGAAFFLADLLGANLLFRWINAGEIRILMYHGISSARLPSFYWTRLDLKEFMRQMKHVRRHYHVAAVSSLVQPGSGSPDSKRNVVMISFDDGYENIYREAWPVLMNLNLRAACFVLPNLSEKGEIIWTDRLYDIIMSNAGMDLDLTRFALGKFHLSNDPEECARICATISRTLKAWPCEKKDAVIRFFHDNCQSGKINNNEFRLMTAEQIRELARSKEFEIGAHTNNHSILSTLTPAEQEKEISESVRLLREWGIEPIPIFAYPNGAPGDFDEHSIAILKRMNFKSAFSTIDGFHDKRDDNFSVRRIPVGADMSEWEFRARLSGFYYFIRRFV